MILGTCVGGDVYKVQRGEDPLVCAWVTEGLRRAPLEHPCPTYTCVSMHHSPLWLIIIHLRAMQHQIQWSAEAYGEQAGTPTRTISAPSFDPRSVRSSEPVQPNGVHTDTWRQHDGTVLNSHMPQMPGPSSLEATSQTTQGPSRPADPGWWINGVFFSKYAMSALHEHVYQPVGSSTSWQEVEHVPASKPPPRRRKSTVEPRAVPKKRQRPEKQHPPEGWSFVSLYSDLTNTCWASQIRRRHFEICARRTSNCKQYCKSHLARPDKNPLKGLDISRTHCLGFVADYVEKGSDRTAIGRAVAACNTIGPSFISMSVSTSQFNEHRHVLAHVVKSFRSQLTENQRTSMLETGGKATKRLIKRCSEAPDPNSRVMLLDSCKCPRSMSLLTHVGSKLSCLMTR